MVSETVRAEIDMPAEACLKDELSNDFDNYVKSACPKLYSLEI